jgi:hypothetical protein
MKRIFFFLGVLMLVFFIIGALPAGNASADIALQAQTESNEP